MKISVIFYPVTDYHLLLVYHQINKYKHANTILVFDEKIFSHISPNLQLLPKSTQIIKVKSNYDSRSAESKFIHSVFSKFSDALFYIYSPGNERCNIASNVISLNKSNNIVLCDDGIAPYSFVTAKTISHWDKYLEPISLCSKIIRAVKKTLYKERFLEYKNIKFIDVVYPELLDNTFGLIQKHNYPDRVCKLGIPKEWTALYFTEKYLLDAHVDYVIFQSGIDKENIIISELLARLIPNKEVNVLIKSRPRSTAGQLILPKMKNVRIHPLSYELAQVPWESFCYHNLNFLRNTGVIGKLSTAMLSMAMAMGMDNVCYIPKARGESAIDDPELFASILCKHSSMKFNFIEVSV